MFNDLLSKACAVLNDRPALKYVYQNPKNGEFVASDGIVMLVESNGAIPMFEYWNSQTKEPILNTTGLEYPDYVTVLSDARKEAVNNADNVKHQPDGLTLIGAYYVSTTNFNIVRSFCGEDVIIKIPNFHGPIYFESVDKSRQALIMPYNTIHCKSEWVVKDVCGLDVGTFKTFKDAESFAEMLGGNYAVRFK